MFDEAADKHYILRTEVRTGIASGFRLLPCFCLFNSRCGVKRELEAPLVDNNFHRLQGVRETRLLLLPLRFSLRIFCLLSICKEGEHTLLAILHTIGKNQEPHGQSSQINLAYQISNGEIVVS